MVEPVNNVERVSGKPSFQPNQQDFPPVKESGGAIKTYLIPLALAVMVLILGNMFWISPNLVTKSDFTTNLSNVSNDIAKLQKSISDINNSVSLATTSATQAVDTANATDKALQALVKSVETANANATKALEQSSKVSGDVALKKDVTDLSTKEQGDVALLQGKINELMSKYDNLNARINLLSTPTPTPDGTNPTPTPGTVGTVTSSYFNSPMIFSKPITTQTRSFGIKLVNNYTDKDLVYVNVTVKLTIANLTAFEDNGEPVLESANGLFEWTYERGTGNTALFTADAYVYVAKGGGEFSDTQKLTLIGNEELEGTYTVSVTSLVINSKTLQ